MKSQFKNIYKTDYGTYRARKSVKGRRVGKCFKRLREAQEWLKSFN